VLLHEQLCELLGHLISAAKNAPRNRNRCAADRGEKGERSVYCLSPFSSSSSQESHERLAVLLGKFEVEGVRINILHISDMRYVTCDMCRALCTYRLPQADTGREGGGGGRLFAIASF
jgi:hypothetical protein